MLRRFTSCSAAPRVGVRTAVQAFTGESLKAAAAGSPAVVDFYADWCGPCQMFAPTFEALSEQFTDVKFMKVNVEEHEDLGAQMDIRAVPTFIALNASGAVVGRVEGVNKQAIEDLVKKAQ